MHRDQDAQLLTARLVTTRRPGQWVGVAVVLVLFAMLVHTVATNPRFQWGLVGDYFFHGSILDGLVLTLWLTAAVMTCGFLLGIGLAAMRLSSLPQAMPAIIPASGNLLIGLLKATSIVSVIAVQDLLYSVQLIYQQNFLVMPLLMVATLWYIILTTILSIGQYFIERHYARGSRRDSGRGFWPVVRGNLPVFGRTRIDLAGLS